MPDLKTNQKRISHDNGSEPSVTIVWGVSLEEIEVGEESACVANENSTEREHRTNQAVLIAIISKLQDKQNTKC